MQLQSTSTAEEIKPIDEVVVIKIIKPQSAEEIKEMLCVLEMIS